MATVITIDNNTDESDLSPTYDTVSRKRHSTTKLIGLQNPAKLKKMQRTIDRLQPGKSKGNLLSKKLPLNETVFSSDKVVNQMTDKKQLNRDPMNEPKLSLGSVLKNEDSFQLICKSLVSSPNPNNEDDNNDKSIYKFTSNNTTDEPSLAIDEEKHKVIISDSEKDVKTSDTDEGKKIKSATPNLSAW